MHSSTNLPTYRSSLLEIDLSSIFRIFCKLEKKQLVETNRLLNLIPWVVDGDDNNDEHLSGKKLPKIFKNYFLFNFLKIHLL